MSDADGLLKVWKEVERLISSNAMHRKGFRLGEIGNDDFVLSQAEGEMQELRKAYDEYALCMVGSDRYVAMELGDLLGVLFHFAIRMGYTPETLSRLMMDKFSRRFSQ